MKKKLLVSLLSLATFPAMAQNKKVVVLGSSSSNSSKKRHKNKEKTMAIKVGALNFITGNLPFYFEKEVQNFGLLIGGGPSFRRFYNGSSVSSAITTADVSYSWGNQNVSSFYNPFSSDIDLKYKYSMGYYFAVSPRYYIQGEGMDGNYVGVQFASMKYNYMNYDYTNTTLNKAGSDQYNDITLQYGAQSGDDGFVFEYYGGIGVRFKNEQRYAYGYDEMNNIVEGTALHKTTGLVFNLGIRLGFKF